MERFLALPPATRASTFVEAAARRALSPGSVEKDFWVCVILRELFLLPELTQHLTFKGGTSLSKAWGLIDRFSEDIDLTIERDLLGFGDTDAPEAAKSKSERQRRLDRLKQACRDMIVGQIEPALATRLREIVAADEGWTLAGDDTDPDGQTLLFAYPRFVASTASSYVNPAVKLEFGARSDPWPTEQREVMSIVAEEFPSLFDVPGCTVRALLPERTFWEKVTLLHEEVFRPPTKHRRPRMARHYYDVWRLIDAGISDKAVLDIGLFERVATHRQVYFRYTWVDYNTMQRGRIQMVPPDDQLDEWRADYDAMRGEMFTGDPPPFDEILGRIRAFQTAFNAG